MHIIFTKKVIFIILKMFRIITHVFGRKFINIQKSLIFLSCESAIITVSVTAWFEIFDLLDITHKFSIILQNENTKRFGRIESLRVFKFQIVFRVKLFHLLSLNLQI